MCFDVSSSAFVFGRMHQRCVPTEGEQVFRRFVVLGRNWRLRLEKDAEHAAYGTTRCDSLSLPPDREVPPKRGKRQVIAVTAGLPIVRPHSKPASMAQ